jgi:pimeloyl-ACP methyl ester carboxylesterase
VSVTPGMANPVVLVHGIASSFELNWREPGWVDLLKDMGRAVIPVDLLGHGTAEKPHDPAAYADLGAGVLAVLPDGPVDAVGFSLGAQVVLGLASEHPDRFGRIVAGGVGANLFRDDDPEAVALAIEEGPSEAGGLGSLFARFAQVPGNDPKAIAACMRRPKRALTAEALAHVACPVLVVLGDKDFAGPADPLMEALPDAQLKTLRGVDHFATPNDFGFIDAALRFLDG